MARHKNLPFAFYMPNILPSNGKLGHFIMLCISTFVPWGGLWILYGKRCYIQSVHFRSVEGSCGAIADSGAITSINLTDLPK